MTGTLLADCDANLMKATQAVEASRSHLQRFTACLSRQANLLKQAESQQTEQDRLSNFLAQASGKLLAVQACLMEVEQELQTL
jgi:multidrug resistance efflux pump